jgi:Trypsin-like peptidase domain
MAQDWTTPIRLLHRDQERGLAFFIDDQHLLTCAHVAATCLGSEETADLRAEGQVIACKDLTAARNSTFRSSLVFYRRALKLGEGTPAEQRLSDLALLRLEDAQRKPIQVVWREPGMGDPVILSGAVADSRGMIEIARGTVARRVEDGRYLVRVESNPVVKPGYSGGPVEHATENALLGVVAKAPQGGGDARIIPAGVIAEALAAYKPISLAPRRSDRWFVYGLVGTNQEKRLFSVGYYRMIQLSRETAMIKDGRVYRLNFETGKIVGIRGYWDSNTFAVEPDLQIFLHRMDRRTIMNRSSQDGPADYSTLIRLHRDARKPLSGDERWQGTFHDLDERREVRGNMLVERLAEGADGHDAATQMAALGPRLVAELAEEAGWAR